MPAEKDKRESWLRSGLRCQKEQLKIWTKAGHDI